MPNRLALEKSPYLLQHAHNPVDWYPWGEEAFAAAREHNKPIFLSIGYSTCHWCHVMEKESFESIQTAEILNKHFVSIKLDREERPDIDRVYMTAVQAMTGQGGWPLSVFLTPELKPFFGGTYFPPEPRWNMPAFAELLKKIALLWETRKDDLMQEAALLTENLKASVRTEAKAQGATLDLAWLERAFESYRSSFDAENGGFSAAPKFPLPVHQHFLFRYWALTGNQEALEMALTTLRRMKDGGIFDHLGGGFHRYSTDAAWRIPHFEKMIYDNAQLAVNFLEAFQITHEASFAQTARSILDYLLRDLRHPEGGFFCAEDADSLSSEDSSEKKEGAFYLWTEAEIRGILGPIADLFCSYYGIKPEGNALFDPNEEFYGKNVLYARENQDARSAHFNPAVNRENLASTIEKARQTMFQARKKRHRPFRDEKVVTSWNGLAISAFAKAAMIFDDASYLTAAAGAARFIQAKLMHGQILYRRWAQGGRAAGATSDDYAFLIQGLLDLFSASRDTQWFDMALCLFEQQKHDFWAQPGGFYLASKNQSQDLLFPIMEDSDGVEPCSSSISTLNALRFFEWTGERKFKETARDILNAFALKMRQRPVSLPIMMGALGYHLSPKKQIILSGNQESKEFKAMSKLLHSKFLPFAAVIETTGADFPALVKTFPHLAPYAPKEAAAAYLCRDFSCQAPAHNTQGLDRLLDKNRR